jgi:hypothetical protein
MLVILDMLKHLGTEHAVKRVVRKRPALPWLNDEIYGWSGSDVHSHMFGCGL